jgi:hypothetical protein
VCSLSQADFLGDLKAIRHESLRYRDLLSRIDALTSIEELSLLAHSPKDEGVFAMMVAAYSDESGDDRTFAVSGLLGLLPDWVELGRLWEQKLNEYRLPEFHAANCENRRKPFEGYERFMRDRFQSEFYGLIAKARLWGFCTAVFQSAYAERMTEFDKLRSGAEGDFTHPYFLAFQHNVEAMCLRLDKEGAPRNEPITFVFDQQKEYEGRAKTLYDSMRNSKGGQINYRHRLGSISFDSRFCQLQLQAADVWAYESRKWISDVKIDRRPDGGRWQFELLNTGRNRISAFEAESLDRLILAMRNDLESKAK